MASGVAMGTHVISAHCPRKTEVCRVHAGFTLLELLVVLVLLSALTGLVAPLAMGQLDRMRERNVAADLQAVLGSLPVRVRQAAAAATFDSASLSAMIDLPEGWSVRTEPELRYAPGGEAAGGRVSLRTATGQVIHWSVAPLTGVVRRSATP